MAREGGKEGRREGEKERKKERRTEYHKIKSFFTTQTRSFFPSTQN